jgi:hypothetical protein
MGELTRVTSAVRAQAADVSHISDPAIVGDQLYATSRYDGALESWTISGNGLSLRDTQDHEGSLRPGDIGWITALDLNGGTQLLTGGGTSGGLVLHDPANTGPLPGGTDLPDTMNIYGTVQHTSTLTLNNGNHVVYGGIAGQDGLAQIILATRAMSSSSGCFQTLVIAMPPRSPPLRAAPPIFTPHLRPKTALALGPPPITAACATSRAWAMTTGFGRPTPQHWSAPPLAGAVFWSLLAQAAGMTVSPCCKCCPTASL